MTIQRPTLSLATVRSTAQSSRGRAIKKNRRRDNLLAYGLLLPAGAFYIMFQVLPIIFAFTLSFFSWNGLNISQATFIGLANYKQLFTDPLFGQVILHNLLVAVAVVIFQCLGSFLLAVIITAGIKGGRFFQLVFFAPVVISSVAVGMISIFIFSPSQGLLNTLLKAIGLGNLQQPWLGSAIWALPSVTATSIASGFGLFLLMFISALGQVNVEMLEAAELDGASQSAIIWQVVFPVIRPVASVVLLLGIVSAFRLFDLVYIMTSGGPYHASDTIVTYLYSVAFSGNQVGLGNAVGVVLFAILLVIALVQLRLTRRPVDE